MLRGGNVSKCEEERVERSEAAAAVVDVVVSFVDVVEHVEADCRIESMENAAALL